jgi:hypothetical protein
MDNPETLATSGTRDTRRRQTKQKNTTQKLKGRTRKVSMNNESERFSPGFPVSSTNKTDRHDITEILLNVALNTINQLIKSFFYSHPYSFLLLVSTVPLSHNISVISWRSVLLVEETGKPGENH